MAKSRRILSLQQFKAAAADEKGEGAADDVVVRFAGAAEVKVAEGGERAIDFILSTAAIDRHGDRIDQDGWDFKSYRRNPVVCWAHDYELLPVAKAKNIRVEDGALKATAVFTAEGKIRFNDIVYELCRDGFLNACSVGFIPKKWSWAEEQDRMLGMEFQQQELLEFSITPIPANPEALIEARCMGERDPEGVMAGWAKGFLGLPADLDDVAAAFGRLREEATTLGKQIEALTVENERLAKNTRQTRRPPPQKEFSRLAPRALSLARLKGSV